MKNIHVLQKNVFNQLGVDHYGKTPTQIKIEEYLINKNIYITSDENIKDGEYGLSKLDEVIKFHRGLDYRYYKKIILTTDQDLIKDGIQAIDDEFLEWFVKNPSCKKVEVDKGYRGVNLFNYKIITPKEELSPFDLKESPITDNEFYQSLEEPEQDEHYLDSYGCTKNEFELSLNFKKEETKQEWKPKEGEEVWIKVFSNWSSGKYIGYDVDKKLHLVREPEEGGGHLFASSDILPYSVLPTEPKQETLDGFINLNSDTVGIGKFHTPKSTPKQETLGGVAPVYMKGWGGITNSENSFNRGVKWQQEQDKNKYSEEEVFNLWNWLNDGFIIRKSLPTKEELLGWFEQFKKNLK